jgi:hypothetical protein
MTRLGATAALAGIVFCALLTSRLDTDAGLYPTPETQVQEAVADMELRAAENACGGDAIRTGRGIRCTQDINQALVANAGVTR